MPTENQPGLRESWDVDPVQAGLAIYPRVPTNLRPSWAVGILSACCDRVSSVPKPVEHVINIGRDPSSWHRAHDAFGAVRKLTLKAEHQPIDKRLHYLLYVAENAAKVIYNASGSSAPFDADSGVWLVRCSREFADNVGDSGFANALWAKVTEYVAGGIQRP